MRILLINPPLPERTYPGKAMALDYLVSVLLENWYDVDISDLDIVGKDNLFPKLKQYQPDVVGITNLSIQNDGANEIAKLVKEFNPNILTIKGGFHELFGYEYSLRYHHYYVDYVVVGEGEKTIIEILDAYTQGVLNTRKKTISGIAYYENGKIHFTSKRIPLVPEELNTIIPKRIFYNKLYNFDVFDGKKTAQMMTVRGCNNSCNFCMESKTGPIERKRSIDSICAEIDELTNNDYEAIYFDDSTFTRDRDRVIKICKLFKDKYPDLIWGCNTRVDYLDEELIDLMEKSRCVYLFTGFESVVPEILIGLNKTHFPSRYLQNSKVIYNYLAKSSIKSSAFLIFGAAKKVQSNPVQYAPESFEDVKNSINFVIQELKPFYISMNVLRLLPGAPFSDNEKFKCIRPNGDVIHAGYYDKEWYRANNQKDIRTRHHIYRAFEGRGSVVPPQMIPEYCYNIFKYAIDAVNGFNSTNHNYSCKIVVDKAFENAYMKEKNGNYAVVPFNEIAEDGSL